MLAGLLSSGFTHVWLADTACKSAFPASVAYVHELCPPLCLQSAGHCHAGELNVYSTHL